MSEMRAQIQPRGDVLVTDSVRSVVHTAPLAPLAAPVSTVPATKSVPQELDIVSSIDASEDLMRRLSDMGPLSRGRDAADAEVSVVQGDHTECQHAPIAPSLAPLSLILPSLIPPSPRVAKQIIPKVDRPAAKRGVDVVALAAPSMKCSDDEEWVLV